MIIPDRLNLVGGIIALIFSFIRGLPWIVRGIGGAFVGAAMLTAMFWLGKLLFKREGVGWGDVKLAFVIGLFIGPFWCFIAILLAIMTGGFWGIFQLIFKKGMIGKEIPFGPFIATGGFLVLFFRFQILFLIEKYMSLY